MNWPTGGAAIYRAADAGKIDVHYVSAAQMAQIRSFQRRLRKNHLWFTFVEIAGEKQDRFLLFDTGIETDPCSDTATLLNGRPHQYFSRSVGYPYVFNGPE